MLQTNPCQFKRFIPSIYKETSKSIRKLTIKSFKSFRYILKNISNTKIALIKNNASQLKFDALELILNKHKKVIVLVLKIVVGIAMIGATLFSAIS